MVLEVPVEGSLLDDIDTPEDYAASARGWRATMSTGAPAYLDPKLAAAVIIADARGILLQQRAMEPRRGLWFSVGIC